MSPPPRGARALATSSSSSSSSADAHVAAPTRRSHALVAGGFAGFAVDVALFPLDTLKTRAQSREGFFKAGGFKDVYKGLGPAALGSFPGAALFFVAYEDAKRRCRDAGASASAGHAAAATAGEIVACLVRVPTENLKQNLQANRYGSFGAAVSAFAARGGWFNGYATTLMRDVPFSVIQFPMWEWMKRGLAEWQRAPCSPIESAALGSLSGAVAAALTTPLDLVKTRLMTSPDKYRGFVHSVRTIHAEEGASAFFRGIEPRVFWISVGGFVYFGAYEEARKALRWIDGGGEA